MLLAASAADVPSAANAVAGSIPATVITANRPERARLHLDFMLWERDFNIKRFLLYKFVSMQKGLHTFVQPFGFWPSTSRPGLFILGIGGF